jgi:FkbM family methyltransferase
MQKKRISIFNYLRERYLRKYLMEMSVKNSLSKFPPFVVLSSDFMTHSILIDGLYEINELNLVQRLFKDYLKDKIIFDVGANIGNHTRVFSRISRGVFSFEPNPFTFEILKVNSISLNNVQLFNYGASDKDCKLKARVPSFNLGGASVENDRYGKDGISKDEMEFDLRAFDGIKELDVNGIGFIKIDVEGHELQAIEGMKNILREHSPIIALEQEKNNFQGGTPQVIERLNHLGYLNMYEFYELDGWKTSQNTLSIFRFIFRSLEALVFGFPSGELGLRKIDALENKDYSMLLLSKKSIEDIL